jgi:hypothetical protein
MRIFKERENILIYSYERSMKQQITNFMELSPS